MSWEMNKFLHKYVKGMVDGLDRESGNYLKPTHLGIQLTSNLTVYADRSVVAQVKENLLTTLDYMIFELSVLVQPNLNERVSAIRDCPSESRSLRIDGKESTTLSDG